MPAPIDAEVLDARGLADTEILQLSRKADAVLTDYYEWTADAIAGLRRCRVICQYEVCVDRIDLYAASRAEITVTHTPAHCIERRAETPRAVPSCPESPQAKEIHMPMTTPALSAPSAGAALEHTTIQRRDLGEHDVLIDIKFCGICHSDIHQVDGDWGEGIFPMVPGHEIAGVVAAVGPGVSRFSVGDRVGVGCWVDSCGECEYCQAGEEQFCQKGGVLTYNALGYDGEPTYGGYSQQIVVTERFVVNIPDGLELRDAAPLLCAGITTYTPLRHWKAGEGKKVAIVGMGGLGHLGVQIAAAMGAEVTVLSQTLSKKDDGLRFGAKHYHATSEESTFTALAGTFDLILNTVSANLDVDAYLSLLRVDGTLVNVGAPAQPDTFNAFSLIGERRSMAGSNTGGIRDTQAMLNFCAEHGIVPAIELVGADQVAEAYGRVTRSDVRYRFVIDVATLGAN